MNQTFKIAREAKLLHINEIAGKLGIKDESLIPYGHYMAKVDLNVLKEKKNRSKLILVSAITPTKSGIGKTTVSGGSRTWDE